MSSLTTTIAKQLEEFQLIQCSLIPGEHFFFKDDEDAWNELLAAHNAADTIFIPENLSPARIHVLLDRCGTGKAICLEAQIPHLYAGNLATHCLPLFSIRGDGVSRLNQEQWKDVIRQKLQEFEHDIEFPIYHLISGHLLPLLHEELDSQAPGLSSEDNSAILTGSLQSRSYHALLTSHHLVSPAKRRSLQSWSASLSITGFAKVGYPGVIYAQGQQKDVEEFVGNIKKMQWLALRVRFVEPLEANLASSGESKKKWSEFQKVGEVVEEMRRLGRERFVVELGIGSASIK